MGVFQKKLQYTIQFHMDDDRSILPNPLQRSELYIGAMCRSVMFKDKLKREYIEVDTLIHACILYVLL